jgi:hypothetical protein
MNFDLKKVKIASDGKVEVCYNLPNEDPTRASKDEVVLISDRYPHPDLKNAINKLNVFLADANALRVHRNLPHIAPKKMEKWNQKEVQDILEILDTQVYASVIPSGISLSGKDESLAVVITGKHEMHGTAGAMNSPRISVNGDTFGFEAAVFEQVYEIIEETRKYVIERKSAQLELEFSESEEEAA